MNDGINRARELARRALMLHVALVDHEIDHNVAASDLFDIILLCGMTIHELHIDTGIAVNAELGRGRPKEMVGLDDGEELDTPRAVAVALLTTATELVGDVARATVGGDLDRRDAQVAIKMAIHYLNSIALKVCACDLLAVLQMDEVTNTRSEA